MERKIYKDLVRWKNSADRKPLILQGARQVGKTYIVNYFAGEEYNNCIYCNFEKDIKLHDFFNQLKINGLSLYYWTSGSQAEVDFITRIGNDNIPVEVKAKINNRARSLSVYIERYKPQYSIRVSQRNFGFENSIKSVPLYAAFCIV